MWMWHESHSSLTAKEKREVEVRLKRMEKGVQRKNELLSKFMDGGLTGLNDGQRVFFSKWPAVMISGHRQVLKWSACGNGPDESRRSWSKRARQGNSQGWSSGVAASTTWIAWLAEMGGAFIWSLEDPNLKPKLLHLPRLPRPAKVRRWWRSVRRSRSVGLTLVRLHGDATECHVHWSAEDWDQSQWSQGWLSCCYSAKNHDSQQSLSERGLNFMEIWRYTSDIRRILYPSCGRYKYMYNHV